MKELTEQERVSSRSNNGRGRGTPRRTKQTVSSKRKQRAPKEDPPRKVKGGTRYQRYQYDEFAREDVKNELSDSEMKIVIDAIQKMKNDLNDGPTRTMKVKKELGRNIDWLGEFNSWNKHMVFPFYCERVAIATKQKEEVWTTVDSPQFREAMSKLCNFTCKRSAIEFKACVSGILLAVKSYRPEIKKYEDESFDIWKRWTYHRLKSLEFFEGDPLPSKTSDCCKYFCLFFLSFFLSFFFILNKHTFVFLSYY